MAGTKNRGRNAKAGDRYRSGDLKPAMSPSAVRRAVDVAKQFGREPLFGSPLGRLRLLDELTDRQVSAGKTYEKIRREADRYLDAPSRSARSPAYGVSFGLSCGANDEDSEIAGRAVRRMTTIRGLVAMSERSQIKVIDLLDRVCLLGEAPASYELESLRRALDAIAAGMRLQ